MSERNYKNRYQKVFAALKKGKQMGFCPFTVMGDPDFETSLRVVRTLVENGADMLELGMPFSDPTADGPTIQMADQRALKAGMTVRKMFEFVRRVREFTDIPIGLLIYYNLILQFGVERFYKEARKAGLDSVLIADMPVEEAAAVSKAAKRHQIAPIFIVSKLTNARRLKQILRYAEGFLYVVSLLGVTGARQNLETDLADLIKRLKRQTNLPLVVGFGISRPEQVQKLKKAGADGFIVGSGIVEKVADGGGDFQRICRKLQVYLKKLDKSHKIDTMRH